ncbi:hypothetical protein FK220_010035 [Flavobacteriaceae bacterium TP-CH-4]|uniref:Uncharacterized protein n=1 Tax=Pelagihabitans pacificus TaxID=2696054 RepID=A0A967B043_9FLAO|nr:hypothetical protein [Pelagihabitans pacificus]NHF59681.1 hypothetical protein [Pelagihabitans pacificus]
MHLRSPSLLLLPLFGMGLFVLLYVIAALKYPGGSWVKPNQEGFSFWYNYLCDLLDYNAINGEMNVARIYARAALGVLCISLLFLWYHLPRLFSKKSLNLQIMLVAGIASLITTMLLASDTHDVTVRIAGLFGVVAFISCFVELFKAGYFRLFALGIICLIVFLVNYYIYETGLLLNALPVIQKITFVLFICWFVLLNLLLFKKLKFDVKKDWKLS